MTDIKIFVSYKNKHTIIKSDILTPIQTGCALTNIHFGGMLRDDSGDNISAQNEKYCELSAQYWVWKNYDKIGNPNYIGFMHYRRHFIFDDWRGNPDWCWLPKSNVYFVPFINNDYLKHLNDNLIRQQLQNCDCIVIKPYDVKNIGSSSCREQYGKLLKQNIKNFDAFIKTAKRVMPDYLPEIELLEKGSIQYLCNMFVMNRELFMQYSEFCFSVLQTADKIIPKHEIYRTMGFLGEFCLSIFVFKLKKNKNIRIKELNAAFILSDDEIKYPKGKYFYYWLMSKISWGEKRQQYKQKRKSLKSMLKFLKNGQ